MRVTKIFLSGFFYVGAETNKPSTLVNVIKQCLLEFILFYTCCAEQHSSISSYVLSGHGFCLDKSECLIQREEAHKSFISQLKIVPIFRMPNWGNIPV